MAKELELRRHTDNDGDVLNDDGVREALRIGERLRGGYSLSVSTGAQRATQALACMLAALTERVPRGVVVEPRLRSEHEDRWKEIASQANGKDLSAFRAVDARFVQAEAQRLSEGLRAVLDRLDEEERALVIGHSPTNEAAIYGLTDLQIAPLSKGGGVLLVCDEKGFQVEQLT
jgi:broad specificity phosphatase PhoE